MKIAIKLPFVNNYLRGDDNNLIVFGSIREMLQYMADKNCTLENLLEFDYEVIDE